jgi:hypothetical protein
MIIGCLSFEERCCALPEQLSNSHCQAIELLEIKDPVDAFPNYSFEANQKIDLHRERLNNSGVKFEITNSELLATEDQLLDLLNICSRNLNRVSAVVLDITSLPKRFFCFLLKRMLLRNEFQNVIVTYTEAGKNGYTQGHLVEDPMTCDSLPGFGGPLPPKGDTLVVSVGFESLNIRSLLEIYSDRKKATKVILSFPPDGEILRRQWIALKQMIEIPQEIRGCLEFIAAWDAEEIYKTLARWGDEANGLTLAPFGSKAHSLGLALYAMKYDVGLYYTQPKSYNPDYSTGQGRTWAYVVKWDGIPCYERYSKHL